MGSKVKAVSRPKASKAGDLKAEHKEPVNGQETEGKEKVAKDGVLKKATRPCGCCPAVLAPLPVGQQYFEAPDGHVIIGETGRGQVMDRRANNGRGGWINPMRG